MKKNIPFCANCLLAFLTALACLAGRLLLVLSPAAVLPRPSVPTLALFSLLALAAECYLCPQAQRPMLPSALLAGAAFALFPRCAGLPAGLPLWALFLAGTTVFGVTDFLYTSIRRRMASGPSTPFAPAVHALALWLASQSLLGLL